jgi:hypothetical protein
MVCARTKDLVIFCTSIQFTVEMDQMGVSQIERPDLVLSPNPLRMEDAVDGDTGGFSDVEGACDEGKMIMFYVQGDCFLQK